MNFGAASEVAPIRRLVLRHPRDAFGGADGIAAQWQMLGYAAAPNFAGACAEFDRFADLLAELGVTVEYLDGDEGGLDSIYVHDPVLISTRGAILCGMGKAARTGEPAAFAPWLARHGVPVIGAIDGDGLLEGGDVVWLDPRTVAVGAGYRTNAAGIAQLRHILGDEIDTLITVPLPHWRGPEEVLHLMSLLSPVDDDLAVAYPPLLPVPFLSWLAERGVRLVAVPEEEFASMGCNVLAVAPRRCIMLAGNPRTRAALEAEGVAVRTYEGREISLKGAGGPTCLTRPVLRD